MAKPKQTEPENKEPLSPEEEEFQLDRIKTCRIECSRVHYKWMGEAIIALRLNKSYECPTMAVDKYWRCYWNPRTVKSWTDAEINAALIHEANHLLRRHSKRALPVHERWNQAADMEINDDIVNSKNPRVTLPKGCCLPKQINMDNGLLAEDYYEHLMKNKTKFKFQDADGNEMGSTSGSGSDGQKRPWEKEAEGTEGNDALSEYGAECVIRKVAENIKQNPGSVSAGMQRWAEDVLNPRIKWENQLKSLISHSLDFVRGQLFKSFKVPSRRQGEFIWPGTITPNPRILCIIDTSGSMCEQRLAECIAEVKGVLRCVKNVSWVSGDTHTCAKGKATKANKIKLEGGGGTDMGRIIEENQKNYDMIIVLTDGYTGWCAPIKPRVIACILHSGDFNYEPPPSWIKTLMINTSE